MATIGDLVTRVALLLQDEDHSAWPEDQKRTQVIEEIQRLSREGLFGEILWRNAVAGTRSVSLPSTVISIESMLYDGKTLRPTTERALATKDESWEQRSQRPQYYLNDLADQETVYVAPPPLVSGSLVPELPPLPLMWKIDDNFIIFTTDNPQGSEGLGQECQVTEWMHDILVFRASSRLSGYKGDYQDEEKSVMMDKIAELFLSVINKDLELNARV